MFIGVKHTVCDNYHEWVDLLALHECGVAHWQDCDTHDAVGFHCIRCGLILRVNRTALSTVYFGNLVYLGWIRKSSTYRPNGATAYCPQNGWVGVFKPWLDSQFYRVRNLTVLDGVLALCDDFR